LGISLCLHTTPVIIFKWNHCSCFLYYNLYLFCLSHWILLYVLHSGACIMLSPLTSQQSAFQRQRQV
jgi:hypothetical protein